MPRQRKTSVASSAGSLTFEPTDMGWARLEQVLGHSIPGELRATLTQIFEDYLEDASFEQNAVSPSQVIRRLEEMENRANAFLNILWETEISGLPDDADIEARYLFQKNLAELEPTLQPTTFQAMCNLMSSASTAFILAKDEAATSAEGGYRVGEAWDVMIRELSEHFRRAELPTGARQDKDKRSEDNTPPFLAFIREVQTFFPEELRLSVQSDEALAKRVNRARSAPARDK
jgi:hypothetical protein